MGLLSKLKQQAEAKRITAELDAQVARKKAEEAAAEAAPELAPEVLGGKKRKYHYKSVDIRVAWQYNGRYGKTLSDLGIVRGDLLQLVPEPQENDPESVSVYWKNVCIGYMHGNRMRNMVIDWTSNGKPVAAYVNGLFPQYQILIEVAFYGYVPKK